ncbi:MAG TPA: NAD(P)/FAD-dependent oxidoreductase, partial [Streptosporangiaceae bacterium]|nr:NAD(P)/FAD-dependent oxidoreductase [Streptosporangiaceae bacterium]
MTTTTQPAEVTTAVQAWLTRFGGALAAGDAEAAAALFTEDCFWRDLVAFTWNIRTFEGRGAVATMLADTLARVRPTGWKITDGEEPAEAGGVTEAWIEFETAVGRGRGHLRLRDGQAWTLLTTLYELKGHEEPRGPNRPMGAQHGASRDRTSWLEDRQREAAELGFTEQPYVLIVGGGQAGIGLAARLRQLDVPAIVIDKRGRPGDQWRSRYKSLCLHDPVWYDHMPYL